MKVYDSMNANLNFQNFGSAWLGVLRGISEDIKLTCNGLYNLCATNGRQEYHNEEETVATFWTSENAMRRFFFNQWYMPREMGGHDIPALKAEAREFAETQLASLMQCHEEFMTFASTAPLVPFGNGTITAARPDEDFKDAVMSHAFATPDSAKRVDTEEI